MTRFGKISAFWHNFDGLFLIWQNVEPTLANLLHYCADFHCCKRPNIENNLTIRSQCTVSHIIWKADFFLFWPIRRYFYFALTMLIVSLSTQRYGDKEQIVFGSSGQHGCLRLRQSEFESPWSLQLFLYNLCVEKNENKPKEAVVGQIFKSEQLV